MTAAATVTFGARKPVHVLAAARCGRGARRRHRARPLPAEPHADVLDRGRRGGAVAAARADGRQVHPGRGRRRGRLGRLPRRGRPRHRRGGARHQRHGPVRGLGGAGGAGPLARGRSRRRRSAAAGRAQAWAVGPGIGTDDAGREVLARRARQGRAGGGRRRRHHPAGPARRAAHGPGRATRRADAARGGVRADRGRRRRATGSPPPAAPPPSWASPCCSRATRRSSPTRTAATLVNPATTSWAATAGSGDVLTGLIGALLAAGLEPWWAAGCAAFVHARAADHRGRRRAHPVLAHPGVDPGRPALARGLSQGLGG